MAQNLRKISTYLFGLRLLRTGISVITLVLAAKFFGISIGRDVWILVSAFIATVNSAVWGPINETFRTKFIFIREQEGESVALRKTSELLFLMIFVTSLISILLFLFRYPLMGIVAPSLASEHSAIFVKMLFLLLPTFVINQMTSIGISVLNAYNYFYIPEIVGFFSGIANLICIIFLAPVIGIYSLVVSQYISIILLLLVIMYYIKTRQIDIKIRFFYIKWSDVRPFVLFALPFFLPYFAGQCSGLLERSLANYLGEGVVSTLDYSRKFTDILQSVLSGILASVMVPVLALHFSKNHFENFRCDLKQNIQVVFIILCLTVPILVGASIPLCKFLYLRGDMTLPVVEEIAAITRLYGVSFVGVAFYLLFGLTLLAQDQGKKYAFYGMMTQIGMIIINVLLFRYMGVYTFAISLFVTHMAAAVWMLKLIKLDVPREIYYYIIKCFLCLLLLVILLTGLNILLKDTSPFYSLIISGIILGSLFIAVGGIFGFNIRKYLKNLMGKKI